MISAGHILASSPVHAWVGFTFIVIDVTVLATPARVTGTFVANAKENFRFDSVTFVWVDLCSSLNLRKHV